MSLLFGSRPELRSIDSLPFDKGGALVSSVPQSLSLIPLYAATTGIADDVSVMPWHGYRDVGGTGVRMGAEPAILRNPGGDGLGFIPWMNQAIMSALLWGFACGLVLQTDSAGWPTIVRWVNPGRVQIDESGPSPILRLNGQSIDWASVVYVPGPVLPGSIVGLSPVSLFRLQFTKSLAAQRYAWQSFDQGIMPPGVLRNAKKVLASGEADFAKSRFKAAVAGRDIFVTGNDWEWTGLSVPDDDARFLDTIKAGATEIAAIYRVTAEDVGGVTGTSMTYQTLEMNQENRNRRALLPWVRRFEAALTAMLPRPQYVKANMDALVRTSLLTRMQAHEVALRTGMETQPEGRALEDKPPLTPEQQAEWMNLYGQRAGQQVTTSEGQ